MFVCDDDLTVESTRSPEKHTDTTHPRLPRGRCPQLNSSDIIRLPNNLLNRALRYRFRLSVLGWSVVTAGHLRFDPVCAQTNPHIAPKAPPVSLNNGNAGAK